MTRDPKNRILMVLPETPYPPRKNGFTVRYHPLIQRLAKIFQLDIVIIGQANDIEPIDMGDLEQLTHTVNFVYNSTRPNSIKEILGAQLRRFWPTGTPYENFSYDAKDIARQIQSIVDAGNYHCIIWVMQSHYLQQCLPFLKHYPLIIDAIDSIALHCTRRDFRRWSLISYLKAGKVLRWEAQMMDCAQTSFYISPVDLQTIKPYIERTSLKLSPNGILIEDYSSEKTSAHSPSIGFLGNMSYPPNVDAAHKLFSIFKHLKIKVPNLSLYIIGRDPDISLEPYKSHQGVYITGTVERIWPIINSIDIFVLPMAIGSGLQNKILEIMYAQKPVVTTTIANGGIGATDGESIFIADDEQTMCEKVLLLLNDTSLREKMARAGGRFVRAEYDWDYIATQFAATIQESIRQ